MVQIKVQLLHVLSASWAIANKKLKYQISSHFEKTSIMYSTTIFLKRETFYRFTQKCYRKSCLVPEARQPRHANTRSPPLPPEVSWFSRAFMSAIVCRHDGFIGTRYTLLCCRIMSG